MGPGFNDCHLYKKRHRDTQGDDPVKTETEIRVMQLPAKGTKDCQQQLDAGKGQERSPPLSLQREHSSADTLILSFQPPELSGDTIVLF